MGIIVIRAENGAETLAGTVVDRGQKLHLAATALPVILYRYPATVGEDKSRHVNRIGVGVLRELSRTRDTAAAVAAHGFDSLEITSKILPRCAFHGIFGPGRESAGQFALDRPQIGHVGTYIKQLDAVDLAAAASELSVGQR